MMSMGLYKASERSSTPCTSSGCSTLMTNVVLGHEIIESGFRVQSLIFSRLVESCSLVVSCDISMNERLWDDRVLFFHNSCVVP